MKEYATAPAILIWEKRIKAAAVFLFLSGIRVGAFVILPLKAIDFETRSVRQWPEFGVHTKNSKRATTYLLNIPSLLKIASSWDEKVRASLEEECLWFAPLSAETGEVDTQPGKVGNHRSDRLRKDLRRWTQRVGIPYHSPHKFRHGNAVYALKQCQNVGELKAVGQKLMHSNLSITDGVYGLLSEEDTKRRILGLGRTQESDDLSS